jgi:hypothetical protein
MSATLAAFALGTLAAPAVLLIQRSDTLAAWRRSRWHRRTNVRHWRREHAAERATHAAHRRNLAARYARDLEQLNAEHAAERARIDRTYKKGSNK